MKLLIVDDEKLTRQGLLTAIDWKKLNITEIYQAEDGRQGLETARRVRPDIILSDIRMPRMNGIEMSERVHAILPDTNIIFMSGYSDLEYLKAAIRLKAVRYIEKPLVAADIEEAVTDAIENTRFLRQSRHSENLHNLAKASRLALEMTVSPAQRPPFSPEMLQDILPVVIRHSMFFTTLLVNLTTVPDTSIQDAIHSFHTDFNTYLQHMHLQQIHVTKYESYVIYHIFGEARTTAAQLNQAALYLKNFLLPLTRFFIAIGDTVNNIEKVYKSYESAVILMQSSFFSDYNTILTPTPNEKPAFTVFTDPAPAYAEALDIQDRERVRHLEKNLYNNLRGNRSLLSNQVKDIYYKLLLSIQKAYHQYHLHNFDITDGADSLLELVQKCYTLHELHQLLTENSEKFFLRLQEQPAASPVIASIKDFIQNNYFHEQLSVKEISEHVHLSSSYVCTVFKNETGSTLNQYITEYRLEKAKQLLSDSQLKISDISSKTGYTDSNYFAKAFKKYVGISPSEYREKMLL